MSHYEILSLPGLSPFSEVHDRMKVLLKDRIEDRIPDTVIFCEHRPVITRGRGLQWKEDRAERSKPLLMIPEQTDYVEIERGGDLTWHGPGQLVIYPVVKLGGDGAIGKKIGQDVDAYVRFLENWWVLSLRRFGVETATRPGGSGVWRQGRKLASVGIAIRRWVTYHGSAMNVVNPLAPFRAFSPCGFDSEVMARLSDQPEIPKDMFQADWRSRWEAFLQEILREMTV